VFVGTRMRDARKAAGLSQEDIARRAGVTLKAIGEVERGEVQDPHYSTLSGIASALGMTVAELVGEESGVDAGKAEAPTPGPSRSGEPSFNDVPGQQRRSEELKHLRAWRAFVWKIEHRWEEGPPQTSREIAVVLDTMQALIDEGAFEQPQDEVTASAGRTDSEGIELRALFLGLQRLNEIADDVERDEAAQRRRKVFELIEGQATA
jgi:transcriptional regulator with XRE-family HTH domain